jgi:hypothetical protein
VPDAQILAAMGLTSASQLTSRKALGLLGVRPGSADAAAYLEAARSSAPAAPPPTDLFATAVYSRGAMTLQALRVRVGDPVFFRIRRAYAARYHYGNVTTADFIAVAEQVSARTCTTSSAPGSTHLAPRRCRRCCPASEPLTYREGNDDDLTAACSLVPAVPLPPLPRAGHRLSGARCGMPMAPLAWLEYAVGAIGRRGKAAALTMRDGRVNLQQPQTSDTSAITPIPGYSVETTNVVCRAACRLPSPSGTETPDGYASMRSRVVPGRPAASQTVTRRASLRASSSASP